MSGTCVMTDGFATHDWGFPPGYLNHGKVKTVCCILKDMGITLWFDEERMEHDNIRNQMTSAIENTKCLVLFITERYQTKVNSMDPNDACYFEFNFACLRLTNRRIIPVVMEKSMLNQKEWKGRLAAELGNHLFVDMTEAMEKIDVGVHPIDNALLKQKCQEIHDRVLKIKSETFLAVNDASSASSTTGDSERFIQLTEQLDWIPGFFDQMESKYHGTVKAQLQQITTLLSTQPITNRLLQSLDYEAIIKKIFRMKPVTTAATGTTSSLALSLSKKKESSSNNKKKNLEIMECFLLILSEGQSELILTILTALNRTLLKESEEKEEDSNSALSPTTADNVSFLDFLTSCGIVEIMEFLIVNLPSKSKGNKVIEFQLLTSVILLMKSLAKNEVNRAAFVEWDFLVAREGATDLADPISYVASAKCVGELCQTIISSVPDGVSSNQLNGEWDHLDESSLLMLLHGFKDYINDLDMLDTLLSALDLLLKDDANNERLASLGLTELLIDAMKKHQVVSYPASLNGVPDEGIATKPKSFIIKVLQVMNSVEIKHMNCSIVLKKESSLFLLSILNGFFFVEKFKWCSSSITGVIRKLTLMFEVYNEAAQLEGLSEIYHAVTKEFLILSRNLMNAGFSWKKLLVDNHHFHSGLSKVCGFDVRLDDADSLLFTVFDLVYVSYEYIMIINEKTVDDNFKTANATSQRNYISMLFLMFSKVDHTSSEKVISWIMSLFRCMLSWSTVKYYLEKQNIVSISAVINRELSSISESSWESSSSLLTVPLGSDACAFLSSVLDLMIQVFQMSQAASSGETGEDSCIAGSAVGGLIEGLFNLLKYNGKDVDLSTKVYSLLSAIMSVTSSFSEFFYEGNIVKKVLMFAVETALTGINLHLVTFPRESFIFVDYLPCSLKTLLLICSNSSNQEYVSLREVLDLIDEKGKSDGDDEATSFFRDLLKRNRNTSKVVEVVLPTISLFSDEVIMTQLLVDAIPDKSSSVEDTENNEESVLDLFVFLLSYHAKNGMIVEHALSLLQRWFQYHKDTAKMMSSTSSKEVLSVIKKIIKSEECRSSKKVLTLLQTLVKSMKEMHKDDVFQATDPQLKVFFSASEMKEAGMTSKEMKEMGYTVKELRDARFTITQLQKELGYSLAELLDGGYLLSDLKEHYSLEDLLSSGVIGYFGVDLKKEGYSIEEVKKAGKTAAEMKNYYSLVEIRDEYGLSVKELLDLGYPASDFFSADPQYRIQCKGFESSVIVNLPFILDLLALFPSNVSSASLLYRGSRDGFDKATYHSKCDNQGPQIEIVKCSEGYIFGGYMAANMPTNGQYIAGSSNASFLFSLKNPGGETAKKYPIKPERNANAFYSQSTPGAFSFGQSTPPAFSFGQSTPPAFSFGQSTPPTFGFGGQSTLHFGVVPEMKTNDLKTVEFGNIASSYEDYGEGNLRFTGKPLSNIAEVEVWKTVNS
jgi:hypothetical protein